MCFSLSETIAQNQVWRYNVSKHSYGSYVFSWKLYKHWTVPTYMDWWSFLNLYESNLNLLFIQAKCDAMRTLYTLAIKSLPHTGNSLLQNFSKISQQTYLFILSYMNLWTSSHLAHFGEYLQHTYIILFILWQNRAWTESWSLKTTIEK